MPLIRPLLSAFTKRKFELCVTHYYRGRDQNTDAVKRFHRAIFLITDSSSDPPRGTVFQVIHGRPVFEYSTSSDIDITLNQGERYSGRTKISEVRERDITAVEDIMRSLEVVQDISREDWDCQSWTMEGVRKLVEGGLVDKDILNWLDEELVKSEIAYVASVEGQS
jgi:plasmid stabilization system protein ParE